MGFLDQIQNKQQAFSKAIPGTEALAGTLKDTFGAFRNGLGIAETRSSGTCEDAARRCPAISARRFAANTAIARRS